MVAVPKFPLQSPANQLIPAKGNTQGMTKGKHSLKPYNIIQPNVTEGESHTNCHRNDGQRKLANSCILPILWLYHFSHCLTTTSTCTWAKLEVTELNFAVLQTAVSHELQTKAHFTSEAIGQWAGALGQAVKKRRWWSLRSCQSHSQLQRLQGNPRRSKDFTGI